MIHGIGAVVVGGAGSVTRFRREVRNILYFPRKIILRTKSLRRQR